MPACRYRVVVLIFLQSRDGRFMGAVASIPHYPFFRSSDCLWPYFVDRVIGYDLVYRYRIYMGEVAFARTAKASKVGSHTAEQDEEDSRLYRTGK